MKAYLAGLGTAVPAMTISRAESFHVANILCGPYMTDSDWLPGVYEHCGVETRHQALGRPLIEDLLAGTRLSASPFLPGAPGGPTTAERMAVYAREAPPLAIQAAREALDKSRVAVTAVTHLVTVSCTGFMAPGIDTILVKELKLTPGTERIHVGFMGCHGAINGLRAASALVAANPDAVVMLVAVELCSLHYYYGADPGKVIANALFSDGAASCVVTGQGSAHGILATGSVLIPGSEREMAWSIGDHGFTMLMTKQIPKLIAMHLRAWLEPWLRSRGLALEGIANWVVHPGGPKILDAVKESLDLAPEDLALSREVLRSHGNMSSPTVLFILQKLMDQPVFGRTVLLAFGPGLVVEIMILE